MYCFGRWDKDLSNPISICERAHQLKNEYRRQDIERIIDVLDKVGDSWSYNSNNYQQAHKFLETSFDSKMNSYMLNVLPLLLNKSSLRKRLQAEFKDLNLLDDFGVVPEYSGEVYYKSHGVLLHITASNVVLGAVDSLIMGLITKNICILKIDASMQNFIKLFIDSIIQIDKDKVLADKFAFFSWKGGEHPCEQIFKKNVNAIIAWGGESSVKSLKKDLPLAVKFIEHGPKISFQVITKKFLEENNIEVVAKKLATDICMWDQHACANSQNLFLQDDIDKEWFLDNLAKAMDRFDIPLGSVSSDEALEKLKEKARSEFLEFKDNLPYRYEQKFFISFDETLNLRSSALNRHLIIKSFKSLVDIVSAIDKYDYYLQTCGLGVSNEEYPLYRFELTSAGVKRITQIGQMLNSVEGSSHDGRFSLLELTEVVCDESSWVDYKHCTHSFSKETVNESIIRNKKGIVYGTGGTTGNPKYVFYSNNEFQRISKTLANSYYDLGLNNNDRVLNLFMAGNLWSSFSAIQYALDDLNVVQFPLGGNASKEQIIKLIDDFNINTLFGIPSNVLELGKSIKGKVKKVFYAGEKLTQKQFDYLKNKLLIEDIFSAGYASVDVGPIGYQTRDCKLNEHYLFDNMLDLKVIDGEGVVTSKFRKAMPIVDYSTGDLIELINDSDRSKTKFKILGRKDQTIFIWSSRIKFVEIAAAYGAEDFQIQIENEVNPVMNIFGMNNVSSEVFIERLLNNCADLRETHDAEYLKNRIKINKQELKANKRTGKTPKLIDLR